MICSKPSKICFRSAKKGRKRNQLASAAEQHALHDKLYISSETENKLVLDKKAGKGSSYYKIPKLHDRTSKHRKTNTF